MGWQLNHRTITVPPFPANAADNGLSVDPGSGHIVLGNDLGFPGTADLLNDREISLSQHTLQLSQFNIHGFDNWKLSLFDNFMSMQDTNTGTKNIYWTVDFAGNTGMFVGNDRTEAGWIPPFILLSDTGTNTFGRLQFSAQDAIEMANAGGGNALALFQSGNAAVQPGGNIDPGYKFFVDGVGANGQMRVETSGFPFFLIDNGNSLYQLGDINASANGSHITIDDANRLFQFIQGGTYLSIDSLNSLYQIGDISGVANGSRLKVNDVSTELSYQDATGQFLSIPNGTGIATIGDINGTTTGSRLDINMSTPVLTFKDTLGDFLDLDGSALNFRIGDLSSIGNNTALFINDPGKSITLNNASITTGNPTGGLTNQAWELGSVVAGAVALDATQSLFVKVNGTLRKILLAA